MKNEEEKKLFLYLEKVWFSKEINYYNYYELFYNERFNEIIPHFYSTNNIEECLHSKLNFYMPTKRHTNLNFIIAIRNIILHYETKSENIIRKDFVTKSFIEYCNSIENNDFKWLTTETETFKSIEKQIIRKEKSTINADAVNEMI